MEAREVVIIGGGAAAIAAAHRLLEAGVDVELLEAAPVLGGNCFSVAVPTADGQTVRVDAGVSDFNRRTFVRFDAMARTLGLTVRPIDETASTMFPDGSLAWTTRDGSLRVPGAPGATDRMADDMARFRREALSVLSSGDDVRLGDFARARGYGAPFIDLYLEPRAAGAFPMPDAAPASYDLRSLVAFWHMHGIVGEAPRERVHITGGMASYCAAFERRFRAGGGRLTTQAQVTAVRRERGRATIECTVAGRREERRADHVVFAVDPTTAARVLADADVLERHALESVPCQRGELVVHTDARLMPADRAAWGAFNYVAPRPGEGLVRPTITFYPHRLSGVVGAEHVFVTLNPCVAPRPDRVLHRRVVRHPLAVAGRRDAPLASVQGRRNTWFAGSYLRAPWLHEQAYASGQAAADAILATDTVIAPARVDASLVAAHA